MDNWQPQKNLAERDWLVEKHKPLVLYLAKRISVSISFRTEMNDLIAYGQLGLIEASERFDPTRGNKFGTFAYYRIKGAIYDGLREMGVITRSQTHRFAANANDVLTTKMDDSASAAGGAASVGDEIKTVENVIDTLIPIYFLSLDAAKTKEIGDETAFTADDLETENLLKRIREIMEELEPEDGELLSKIYFKNMLMKDLAKEMGVSKSWVSRLHARAVEHLQELLREHGILEEYGEATEN